MKTNYRIALFFAALGMLTLFGVNLGISHAASEWTAKYWNNRNLTGNPVLTRTESELNYDWGTGSPDALVPTDNFSAQWERLISVNTGTYRFSATMDDGMRVWLDDVLVIDSWWDSQVHSAAADIYLNGGEHRLKVQYYDAGGQAVARLSWAQVGSVPGAFNNWRGEYFNNMTLSGQPVLVRDDRELNFDWGGGSPAWNVVSADNFSARWSRSVYLSPGRYRFVAAADDGARLWVNGQLLIDQWHDASATFYSAEMDIAGGSTDIKMEYYERNGGAVAQLSWLRISSGTFNFWRGEYYNNQWLSGAPVLVRDDASINFNWGSGSPDAVVPSNYFSVRWNRELNFSAGTYRFTTTTDDGIRLWVNGNLVIDQWREQPATSYSVDIYLSGNVPIKMEYYEANSTASASLTWSRIDGSTPPNPPAPATPPAPGTVIVDDADTGFIKGGAARSWRRDGGGYNNQLTWTWNNDKVRANYNWGRWYPKLAAGQYEVFVYIPTAHNSTDNARYWISHRGGYSLRTVDQSANGGRWVSLGTYEFRGSIRDYVSLADVTFETLTSHQIVYDAAKWESR